MLPSEVLSGAPSRSFWQWRVVEFWPGDILKLRFVFLVKKHAAFKWKDAIFGFPVSQSSAEALVRWGGKIKYILVAYFHGHICSKNCRNRNVSVKSIASQKWDVFWDTAYVKQEGQHPLTGQRAANFRLQANQWAERRLVTQWRHGCRAMRRSVCIASASSAGRSLCVQISRERSYPQPTSFSISCDWGATRQIVSKLAAFRRGRSLGAKISGESGRSPSNILIPLES